MLVEKTRIGFRFDTVPRAPLIDNQSHSLSRIIPVHNAGVPCDDPIDPAGFAEHIEPFRLTKFRCGAAERIVGACIIMNAQSVHHPPGLLHQDFRPRVIIPVAAAGDLVNSVVRKIADICLVSFVNIGIVFGCHVSAAAPVFIPHAEVGELPWVFPPVLSPQVSHGTDTVKCHVFDPFLHFLNGAASDIPADIGFCADHITEVHKFMCAKVVIFGDTSPVSIDHRRPF